METYSDRFVGKLYHLGHSDIPQQVLLKAKSCLLDYIGVVYAASGIYQSNNWQYIDENKRYGSIDILGSGFKVDLHTAVMVNAFNAHLLELDDSHRVAMTHLGAPIISALIGVGELKECTIQEVLCGIVVGYEAAIRLASVIQPSHKLRGFHVSGTCCTIGAAMGIASMLGYSIEEMKNAFSASTTTAAGLLEVIGGNSEQKPYNIANAAVAGMNAALYGKLFIGANDILNGSRGFFRAVSDEFHLDKANDYEYAILGIYQKIYSSCRHCHAPLEAALNIHNEFGISCDDIESVYVETYDLAIAGHDHTDITCISSAKQSIPYAVAVALARGDGGMASYTNSVMNDVQIKRLTKKITVSSNTELSALVPGKRPAIVTVSLKNGRSIKRRVDYAKGEPENPLTEKELDDKFMALFEHSGHSSENALAIKNTIFESTDAKINTLFETQN